MFYTAPWPGHPVWPGSELQSAGVDITGLQGMCVEDRLRLSGGPVEYRGGCNYLTRIQFGKGEGLAAWSAELVALTKSMSLPVYGIIGKRVAMSLSGFATSAGHGHTKSLICTGGAH